MSDHKIWGSRDLTEPGIENEIKTQKTEPFRVLALDGGGAKGFYTLGVLKEIEAAAGCPLCEKFDLIFGTSTGAIIASLLALGKTVDEIHTLYRDNVPDLMATWFKSRRSRVLKELADKVFSDAKFDQLKTGLGVVTARWDFETPMIFKGDVAQAHGRHATFVPGFGCTISEAVQASCSAYPFFNRKTIKTSDDRIVELIDGGYCANNPTLYALADALKSLKNEHGAVRVVSVGVGMYPTPKRWNLARVFGWLPSVQLLQKTLSINTLSMEQLRVILFKDVPTIRINERFPMPEMATDLMEHDLKKLNILHQRGRDSFAAHEAQIREYLGVANVDTRSPA